MKRGNMLNKAISRATAIQLGLVFLSGCSFQTSFDSTEQNEQQPNYSIQGQIPLSHLTVHANLKNMHTKADLKYVELDYTDANGKVFHYHAQMKLQGNSSLQYEKKNYNITFYSDETYTEKLNVDFGLGGGVIKMDAQSKLD